MVFVQIKSDHIKTSPEIILPLLSACVAETFCIISISSIILSSAFLHKAKLQHRMLFWSHHVLSKDRITIVCIVPGSS